MALLRAFIRDTRASAEAMSWTLVNYAGIGIFAAVVSVFTLLGNALAARLTAIVQTGCG